MEFKVGQEVCIKDGNILLPGRITKIGRKYITVNENWKYEIRDYFPLYGEYNRELYLSERHQKSCSMQKATANYLIRKYSSGLCNLNIQQLNTLDKTIFDMLQSNKIQNL